MTMWHLKLHQATFHTLSPKTHQSVLHCESFTCGRCHSPQWLFELHHYSCSLWTSSKTYFILWYIHKSASEQSVSSRLRKVQLPVMTITSFPRLLGLCLKPNIFSWTINTVCCFLWSKRLTLCISRIFLPKDRGWPAVLSGRNGVAAARKGAVSHSSAAQVLFLEMNVVLPDAGALRVPLLLCHIT